MRSAAHAAAAFHVLRREVHQRRAQLIEAVGVFAAELRVVEPLLEDHAQHAREQCRIFAGPDLQMEVRAPGQLGAARIHADELQAALPGVVETLDRVGAGRRAGQGEARDERIAADRERHVGAGERVPATAPDAVSRHRDDLGGLIDRERRVVRRRPDAPVPGARHGHRCRIHEGRGAAVARHRARAVAFDDPFEPPGDRVERAFGCDRLEAASPPSRERAAQPLRPVDLVGKLATLDAAVAARHGVARVASHGRHAPGLDRDLHGAERGADPAVGLLVLDGHAGPLACEPRAPAARFVWDGRRRLAWSNPWIESGWTLGGGSEADADAHGRCPSTCQLPSRGRFS